MVEKNLVKGAWLNAPKYATDRLPEPPDPLELHFWDPDLPFVF